jgi:hypothetical protein
MVAPTEVARAVADVPVLLRAARRTTADSPACFRCRLVAIRPASVAGRSQFGLFSPQVRSEFGLLPP